MLDTVIRGAELIDGTGRPPTHGAREYVDAALDTERNVEARNRGG